MTVTAVTALTAVVVEWAESAARRVSGWLRAGGVGLVGACACACAFAFGCNDAPGVAGGDTFVYETLEVQAHTHEVVIPVDILANPPGNGYTTNTEVANGHSHTGVEIFQNELISLSDGGPAPEITLFRNPRTANGGTPQHRHQYTFTYPIE